MGSSLATGVTGLTSQQKMLEVIGNNLANLSTTGFKTQRALFSDLFYETVQSASGSTPGLAGGTNPIQVGSGSRVSQVDSIRTQGNLVATGVPLDLGIEGEGLFVVKNGSETFFTRNGAFKVDDAGLLVDPSTGNRVQRFGSVGEAGASGGGFQIPGNSDIRIPYGTTIPGKMTTTISLSGNLPADGNGPIAEILQNQASWTSGGSPAASGTLLNNLDLNSTDYTGGDVLEINGTDVDGTAISTTLNVDGTTTLGDLVASVSAAYPGATASLDANGRVVLTADTPGESFLSLSIDDAATNTGSTGFSTNLFLVDTKGEGGSIVRGGVDIYDPAGGSHNIQLEFEKQTDGTWTLTGNVDPSQGTVVDGAVSGIAFNADGSIAQAGGIGAGNTMMSFLFDGMSDPLNVEVGFGEQGGFEGMTNLSSDAIFGADQNGLPAGSLSTVQISADGMVNGIASNGTVVPLAQLAIATFQNPDGLTKEGATNFGTSLSSGEPEIGTGLVGGRGAIRGGQLEQSNVDIAQQFTQLIVAQRGFSANARTITVADQILQEATNLIR